MIGKSQNAAPASLQERRKHRRFPLRYPVSVICHGSSSYQMQAVSRNIGLYGILLEANMPLPLDSEVTFVISVQEDYIARPIRLTGEGHVVRVGRMSSGGCRRAAPLELPSVAAAPSRR
jgi:hypothetical protein